MNWLQKKGYGFFYSATYTFKVLRQSRKLWPLGFWLKFWLTTKPYREINVCGYCFLIRSDTFMAKLIDLYVILENIIDERYFEASPPSSSGVIIDIGAHIGAFTLAAAKQNPRGRVFSFEPFPGHYQVLLENIKRNGLTNVWAFNTAVAADNRGRKLYLNSVNNSGHSITKKSNRFINVPTVSLEAIFDSNNIEECDFLKMDCEGMEFEILLNTPPRLLQRIKRIALEYHLPQFFGLGENKLLEALISHLRNNNFKTQVIKDDYQRGYLFGNNLS